MAPMCSDVARTGQSEVDCTVGGEWTKHHLNVNLTLVFYSIQRRPGWD